MLDWLTCHLRGTGKSRHFIERLPEAHIESFLKVFGSRSPSSPYLPASGRTTDQSRDLCSGSAGSAAEQQGDRRKTVHFNNNRQRTPAEHLREAQRQKAPSGD